MADNYQIQMQNAQKFFLRYDQEKLIRKFAGYIRLLTVNFCVKALKMRNLLTAKMTWGLKACAKQRCPIIR